MFDCRLFTAEAPINAAFLDNSSSLSSPVIGELYLPLSNNSPDNKKGVSGADPLTQTQPITNLDLFCSDQTD
jgi:hypothetical protein